MDVVYAVLKLPDQTVYNMKKKHIVIGRSSAACSVDIDVGSSAYVSRDHVEIFFKKGALKLRCKGKNGIFIGKSFQPRCHSLRSIPSRLRELSTRVGSSSISDTEISKSFCYIPTIDMNRCTLRFPSTSIIVKVRKCFKSVPHCNEHEEHLNKFEEDQSAFGNAISTNDPNSTQKSDINFPESMDSCLRSAEPLSPGSGILTQSRTRRKQALIPSDRILNRTYFRSKHSLEPTTEDRPKLEPNANSTGLSDVSSNPNSVTPNHPFEAKSKQNNVSPTPVSQNSIIKPSLVIRNLQNLVSKSANYRSVICLAQLATLDRGDRFNKPPYSYAQLIAQAIASQPDHQLTLSGIYDYISSNYPYYQPTDKGWQNSVRHNLSLNRQFIKVPRSQDDHGKGCFWRIDPMHEAKLLSLAFRKRRIRGFETVSRMQTVSRNLSFLCRSQDSRYIIPSSTLNNHEPISTSSAISNDTMKTIYAISTCHGTTRPVQLALEIPTQASCTSSSNQRLPTYPIRIMTPKTTLQTALQNAKVIFPSENSCSVESLAKADDKLDLNGTS